MAIDMTMLNMDFPGLKTLSVIKDAVETIENSKGKKIDSDKIGLIDPPTFLFNFNWHY